MFDRPKHLTRFLKARSQVVMADPFFGELLLRQQVVATPRVETVATNGDVIYYNPEYVDGAAMHDLHFHCAHSALTAGLQHPMRRGKRDFRLWGRASDLAVNPILRAVGFHLPEGAPIDERFKGKTVEEIYRMLYQEGGGGGGSGGGEGDGGGTGQGGGHPGPEDQVPDHDGGGACVDAPVEDPMERQQQQREWRAALGRAAKGIGAITAELERELDAVLRPKADWRELLRRWMDQFSTFDYSWASPNRRFIGAGLYLPSMRPSAMDGIGPLCFVIDASGSMPDEALRQAMSEISAAAQDLRPQWIDVIVHDTEVKRHQRFELDDDLKMRVSAGGGTAFVPAARWICDRMASGEATYSAVIWFTDLMTDDLEQCPRPRCPLLWMDYGGEKREGEPYYPSWGDDYVAVALDEEAA